MTHPRACLYKSLPITPCNPTNLCPNHPFTIPASLPANLTNPTPSPSSILLKHHNTSSSNPTLVRGLCWISANSASSV